MALSQNVLQWAAERSISRSTLERLGVGSGTTAIAGNSQCEVIAFPYRRGKDIVNVKYRAIESKDFKQVEGGELRFWNLDCVLGSAIEVVYITEGEMDSLALIEAGVPASQVVSVPNGAPQRSSDKPDEMDRYRYVGKGMEEGLSRAKRFVLAGDMDAPGMALRQDLVRLLGAARCWFIDWPDGLKDANAFLIAHGAESLQAYISDGAKEWPVEGLYRLSDLPDQPPLEVWNPGFPEWESKLRFAAKTVSVVTGQPGHGKTVLMMQLWYQICRDYNITVAMASFETRPKPHQRRNIRQFMYGRPDLQLTAEEIEYADKWNDDHMLWIVHPNRRPTLSWLLEMAEIAVVRNNARMIQIDPWNKLESDRPNDMRETDWIGQCLDEIMDFAQDFNVHVQILAHPAKMMSGDSRKRPPGLEDISGSKHWENKVDLGLAVHRPSLFEDGERKTEATLYVLKSRFEELGHPCKLDLDFDLSKRRYVSVDYKVGR